MRMVDVEVVQVSFQGEQCCRDYVDVFEGGERVVVCALDAVCSVCASRFRVSYLVGVSRCVAIPFAVAHGRS
jgi:arginine/ornithine N-succinyltransferase beta subunit